MAEPQPAKASHITLYGRTYYLPRQPTVVICVDGFDPTYLAAGIKAGILPNLAQLAERGFHTTAKSCMPSFTNPNNVSIITGRPPSVHGIAGNFYLDRRTGEERMIKDASLLRGSTILEQMSKHGVRVAAVTAKDKLRRILSHGLEGGGGGGGGICFSAECAGHASLAENGVEGVEAWIGRPAPPQYSGDLSLYVLDAGVRLLEENRAELLYLTLSDYIQHKHAPGEPESDAFLAALDQRIGRLVGLGAVVAVTGDHGMSDKCDERGQPNILFLEDSLVGRWGVGCARVICPITDPFVRHHGALGSFVRVYVRRPDEVSAMMEFCKTLSQVEHVLDGQTAARLLDLPLDTEGDIVIVSKKNAVIGSRKEEHDLTSISDHRLRSHGGYSEQEVPLMLSKPVQGGEEVAKRDWRNYDVFDLALNW